MDKGVVKFWLRCFLWSGATSCVHKILPRCAIRARHSKVVKHTTTLLWSKAPATESSSSSPVQGAPDGQHSLCLVVGLVACAQREHRVCTW